MDDRRLPSAAGYFEMLADCLRGTQVTDQQGTQLSLEEGAQTGIALILKTGKRGKILVIGNGGSAAIASHVQNDLCNSVKVKAMVLTETALFTGLTNDYGYTEAYERLVQLWATPDDLLIAISSSGQSENILRAAYTATERQCTVMTFTGFKPANPLRRMGALNFYVASDRYGFVELSHSAHLHFLTDAAALQRALVEQPQGVVAPGVDD
jgi:D-sedoheptulose 7-phosphate isomerase